MLNSERALLEYDDIIKKQFSIWFSFCPFHVLQLMLALEMLYFCDFVAIYRISANERNEQFITIPIVSTSKLKNHMQSQMQMQQQPL